MTVVLMSYEWVYWYFCALEMQKYVYVTTRSEKI